MAVYEKNVNSVIDYINHLSQNIKHDIQQQLTDAVKQKQLNLGEQELKLSQLIVAAVIDSKFDKSEFVLRKILEEEFEDVCIKK